MIRRSLIVSLFVFAVHSQSRPTRPWPSSCVRNARSPILEEVHAAHGFTFALPANGRHRLEGDVQRYVQPALQKERRSPRRR